MDQAGTRGIVSRSTYVLYVQVQYIRIRPATGDTTSPGSFRHWFENQDSPVARPFCQIGRQTRRKGHLVLDQDQGYPSVARDHKLHGEKRERSLATLVLGQSSEPLGKGRDGDRVAGVQVGANRGSTQESSAP